MPEQVVAASPENGGALLDEISAFISRYLVIGTSAADAIALWIVHTHALDVAQFTPYLHIYSPLPRAGKTLLLDVLSLLVAKPWLTGRVTAAVLVRKTAKESPTLLLDESDAAFQGDKDYSEALRGILNTGFERNGVMSMCVKKAGDWSYEDFPTFSAKAIAGIGRLPHTIEDRSLTIPLKRKLPDERRERFRRHKVEPQGKQLHDRLERWATENAATLRDSEPSLPEELNDRHQDVCEPLLAIADQVGAEWPARARRALVELCTDKSNDDRSPSLRLLNDIRRAFDSPGVDKLSTSQLLQKLKQDETAPWREWNRGNPLTSSQLAGMLKPFDIFPRDRRFGAKTLKGYARGDFEDCWTRYLALSIPAVAAPQQGQQAAVYASPSDSVEGQQSALVASSNGQESPISTQAVADVAPAILVVHEKVRARFCWIHAFDDSWQRDADGTLVCGRCAAPSKPESRNAPLVKACA